MNSLVGSLSIIGLSVAIGTLFTVLAIINGFDQELRERLLAATPHGVIYSRNPDLNLADFRQEVIPHPNIAGVSPLVESKGMVVATGNLASIKLKGIDPVLEKTVSILPDYMVSGHFDELSKEGFRVVIGEELARQLNVVKGGWMTLVLPEISFSMAGPHLTTRRLSIAGIYRLGLDMDRDVVFMDIDDVKKLKRQAFIDGLTIKTKDIFLATQTIFDVVYSKESLYGYSWERQNGALYDAIGTQKATLAFLVMFLVIAAVFNVSSNLVLTVNDAKSDIAILRTMGASNNDISIVFLLGGIYIGVLGLLGGLVLGFLITTFLPLIFNSLNDFYQAGLMKEYFIKYLPTKILLEDVSAIFLATLLSTMLFSVIPARRAAKIHPAKVLSFEI